MVRPFVRLKLTLIFNSLRSGWVAAVGVIGGLIVGLPVAIGGFIVFSAGRLRPDLGALGLPIVFTGIFIAWVLFPIIGGSDETLDPQKLSLLPISRPTLMIGLTASSIVGVGSLCTAIALAGVVVGFTPAGPGALLVIAGTVALFFMCITAARALTTTLARVLTSRKGREFVFGVGILLVTAASIAPQLVIGRLRLGSLRSFEPIVDSLGYLPPGWAARAVTSGAEGDLLEGLGWLMACVVTILLMVVVWGWSLARLTSTTERVRTKSAPEPKDLRRGLARLFPASPLGSVAAMALLYWRREPRRRTGLIVPLFSFLIVLLYASTRVDRPEIVLAGGFVGLMLGLQTFNAFGQDGEGIWMEFLAIADSRDSVQGRNVAATAAAVSIMTVFVVLLALFTSGWSYALASILIGISLLWVVLAVSAPLSVRIPFALPETRNVFAMNTGIGATEAVSQFLGMMIAFALSIPIIVGILMAFSSSPWVLTFVSVLAAAYSYLILVQGTRIAVADLKHRQPEVLKALEKSPR